MSKCTRCDAKAVTKSNRCRDCENYTKDASRFGTTYEHIKELRAIKKCDCCGLTTEGERNHHIDHCHTSGFIRGVLCRTCNVMLGYAKDNPQRLLNGIKYLESFYSWDSVLKQ